MTYRIKHILLAAVTLCGATSPTVYAGDQPTTVVELFTSQGCSSCPPANEFVGTLIDDEDKLVLSYGVTYWDYLGWEDTFGDPEFTQRQKAYGAALDIGYVYTPQIVLNGRDHNSRYTSEKVEKVQPLAPSDIQLTISEEKGRVAIDTNAPQVVIVTYTPGWQEVAVKRGENHGRKLKIANVVDDVERVKKSGRTKVEIEPGKAYAALVHDPITLQITAARILRNP